MIAAVSQLGLQCIVRRQYLAFVEAGLRWGLAARLFVRQFLAPIWPRHSMRLPVEARPQPYCSNLESGGLATAPAQGEVQEQGPEVTLRAAIAVTT